MGLRRLTVLKETNPPPGVLTIARAVEKNREILICSAAVREMGHDELLMNSLNRLSHWQRRHSLAGPEQLICNFKPNELRSVSLLCTALLMLGDSAVSIRAALRRIALFCSKNFADRGSDREKFRRFLAHA